MAVTMVSGCNGSRYPSDDGGPDLPDMAEPGQVSDIATTRPPDQPHYIADMAVAPGPYCTGSSDLGGLFPLGCGQAGGACCEGFQGEPLQCAPRLVCAQIGSRHVCADPGFSCNEPR